MTNSALPHADDVLFRSARTADIPHLRELYLQLIPEEHPSPRNMEETLADILANPRFGEIVVGQWGERVIATCQVVRYDNLIRTPHIKAVVDSVVVGDGFRHRGIGTAMMGWVVEDLARRGCSKVVVATAFGRVEAHGLYEKLRFERFGYSYVRTVDRS